MARREFPDAPIVGVGAVVLCEGQVLLVRRGREPLKGAWSLPGGALELGETLEAGTRREVAEETGLLVEIGQRLGVLDKIVLEEGNSDESGGESPVGRVRYHYVLIDFLCKPLGGTLGCASDASDARWVPRGDVSVEGPYRLDKATADMIEMGFRAADLERR